MPGPRDLRVRMPAASGDLLPTHELVQAAKHCAIGACADRLAAMPWPPSGDTARRHVDMIPMVAMGALVEMCPGVPDMRLARILGLDPLKAIDDLACADAANAEVSVDVARVVAELRGRAA